MKALDNRFYVKFMQLEIGLLIRHRPPKPRITDSSPVKIDILLLLLGHLSTKCLLLNRKFRNRNAPGDQK